jgi:hypothetical protein
MKWWFIQWILMTMWWWSLWFWGNLFWDDGYTLLRASTVPTTVGPLVPRDVSMTIRFIWNWLMIRTSGGTLMKGTWNWGCLFDLVCLPAKLRFDIYIYTYITYIHIYERLYMIYMGYLNVSELCHRMCYVKYAFTRFSRAKVLTRGVPNCKPVNFQLRCYITMAWWWHFLPFLAHDDYRKNMKKPLLLDVWEYWWNVGRMRAFYESVWVSSWWRRCCLCYVGALLCFKCVLCMGVVCLFI